MGAKSESLKCRTQETLSLWRRGNASVGIHLARGLLGPPTQQAGAEGYPHRDAPVVLLPDVPGRPLPRSRGSGRCCRLWTASRNHLSQGPLAGPSCHDRLKRVLTSGTWPWAPPSCGPRSRPALPPSDQSAGPLSRQTRPLFPPRKLITDASFCCH